MDSYLPYLIAIGPTSLLVGGLIPSEWANSRVGAMKRIVAGLTAFALAAGSAAAVWAAFAGPVDARLVSVFASPLSIGVYFDSLSAIMMLLISFIGCIIVRYSNQYLDGEPMQGRFLRWISFTMGAALLLTASSNLAMFTAAWVLTSFGLHQLLTHYKDRPAAILAARKKFLISRFGDVLLIAAICLTYQVFGSLEYTEVFAAAQKLHENPAGVPWAASLISSLFVIGAMTKSAQFPLHSWLPDTMETPTPVSALMHAGIINAGGFLVIRLSPLISLSSVALDFLAAVGAFTAVYAAVVALTQTSVKRLLAYSTIAQMGFMMLQCGLGAFSAALLHIVAHSLYKAHAFLSSGGVLEQAARTKVDIRTSGVRPTVVSLPAAALAAAAICMTLAWLFGAASEEKPGALALGFILALALTQLLYVAIRSNQIGVAWDGLLAAVLACGSYYAGLTLFDWALRDSVTHRIVAHTRFDTALMLLAAAAFLAVFGLQVGLSRFSRAPIFKSLYVHAVNGFYVDLAAHKLVSRLWVAR